MSPILRKMGGNIKALAFKRVKHTSLHLKKSVYFCVIVFPYKLITWYRT